MTEPRTTPPSTSEPGAPAPGRRVPLSRDRLLTVAVELADAAGIAGLTIRALAAASGVKPMTIYHHVRDKDEILDLVVDAVFAEIDLPDVDLPWRDALRDRTASVRAVLARHRWAIGLLESRSNAGPATLRHHDTMLGIMRRAGFGIAGAAHAYALLDSYAYGFALQEATLPFDDAAGLADLAAGFTEIIGDDHPYLAEMLHGHVLQPGYSFADEFEIGLEVVLDAIERWRIDGATTSTAPTIVE